MQVFRIDSSGNYIEPVILADGSTVPSDCVTTQPPDGMYQPQWVSGAWVDAKAPSAADLLAQAQQAQIATLTAARDAAIAAAGFTSAADGTSRQYRSDAASQLLMMQLSGAIDRGIEQYPQAWVAADGTQVQFTDASQVTQFLADFATMEKQYWDTYMPLQHQVMSATTVEAVQAVTWPTSST